MKYNDMDYMRISGTEPSSVILSQTCCIKKLKINDKKVPKQAEAKRDDIMNPPNYNFNQFETRKILMLSKRYESTEVDRRTWLPCALVDSLVHQQWHSSK